MERSVTETAKIIITKVMLKNRERMPKDTCYTFLSSYQNNHGENYS
jgi:hypothetical protein